MDEIVLLALILFGFAGAAKAKDAGFSETPGSPTAEGTVNGYLSATPKQGALYQIKAGDNAITIARRALGVGQGSPRSAPYVRRMTQVLVNRRLYGTPLQDPANEGYGGQFFAHDGLTLARAFLPRNDDALALLRSGTPPQGWQGTPGGSYGLLWLPAETGEPLDPPPDLRSLYG